MDDRCAGIAVLGVRLNTATLGGTADAMTSCVLTSHDPDRARRLRALDRPEITPQKGEDRLCFVQTECPPQVDLVLVRRPDGAKSEHRALEPGKNGRNAVGRRLGDGHDETQIAWPSRIGLNDRRPLAIEETRRPGQFHAVETTGGTAARLHQNQW